MGHRAVLLALVLCAALATPAGAHVWLAGDDHVHTCASHDAYCPPGDDNTGPDTAYSAFGTVGERFSEAAAKGLSFVVISDHDDVRAWSDPAFGSHGVVGIRGFEHSLAGGHAQAIGVTALHREADPAAFAAAVRADGGIVQINHPAYKGTAPVRSCDDVAAGGPALHWKYGFSVAPDTLEAWNATTLLEPSEAIWECWLQRGVRLPAMAGSDTHGASQPTLGVPTVWVRARDRSERAIVDAMRAGRTTISRQPPALGGARLVLEADRDRDGTFESSMGDVVRGGAAMRVRADGLAAPATVRVRANGATLLERELLPGRAVAFTAPRAAGWVRATLFTQERTRPADPFCAPGNLPSSASVTLCSADLSTLAMSSPVWLRRPTGARRRHRP